MGKLSFTATALISAAAVFACGNPEGDIEGTKTLVADGAEIIWIRDNAGPRLMERTLFPDAPDSLITALGLENGVPSSVSAFLVRIEGKLLLFDTGLGAGNSRLAPTLDALGIDASDIDAIFLTHMHGDHIGGMLKDGSAAFPEAEVYVAEAEYNAWMSMPSGQNALETSVVETYKDRLHIFSEDEVLPYGVKQIPAYGHTPGHTVYQTGAFLIAGDLMHGTALQMPHPEICAEYDMDKPEATSSRIRILDYARNNGLTIAGMHFPDPAFIKLSE